MTSHIFSFWGNYVTPFDYIYGNSMTPFVLAIKGKVFYGQEPPSGESTTTKCGVNYQLLPDKKNEDI